MAQQEYPAGHLSFIKTALSRPLTVFLPPVHRHMDAQYVEAFKEKGHLRISSFAVFKQHKDEHRGDKSEGSAFSLVNDTENNRSFGVFTVSGSNAYALSATARTGPDISEAFGPSSFEIFELIGFSAAIANELPGCTGAMISQCIYVDQKMLVSTGAAPSVEDFKVDGDSKNLSLEKVMSYGSSITGPKPRFLKDRKFEWQTEYRFIWETNKPVTSHLDIVAPEVRRFCKFKDN